MTVEMKTENSSTIYASMFGILEDVLETTA